MCVCMIQEVYQMVSIIEVTDKTQLRRFVDYPNEL